jgi:MoaA/NifB/PqqE/SkfB family radical SAM enzyme
MFDIRRVKNGYWWKASEKFESLINNENKLIEMTIQITDKCNMNCIKCNKINFTNMDMPKDKVISIIDQAYELGLKHIHFTGGEATLHTDFPYIIEYCRQKGLRIDTSSNGKFSLETAQKLVKAGLNSINISWDYIDNPPECIDFIFNLGIDVFINHMVMPDNYMELLAFLNHIRSKYDKVIDIQLMPPRGNAEKFTTDEIIEFEESMTEKCYIVSKIRFPMVANKIRELLSCPETEHGIYHHKIKWHCHRSKSEIRVGLKGFVTCTYLYRDGHVTCDLDKSVREAWDLCKKECCGNPPIKEMCDYSCSPEVAYFNYFVDKEIQRKKR